MVDFVVYLTMRSKDELFVDMSEFNAKCVFKREEIGDAMDIRSNYLKSELLELATAELKKLVDKHKLL
jgi:hypothetical protein